MTKVSKSHYGWQAEDYLPMASGRTLHVLTMKRYGGCVSTTAHSVVMATDHGGYSCIPMQDFNATLGTAKLRGTEKAIATFHAQHLASIADVLTRANTHQAHQARVAHLSN